MSLLIFRIFSVLLAKFVIKCGVTEIWLSHASYGRKAKQIRKKCIWEDYS